MLFDSYIYFVFFTLVLLLTSCLQFRKQNYLLLIASYFFYGFWSIKFLSLIFLSTLIDFFCANKIEKTKNPKTRKKLLAISLIANMSFLGFFKYANFFVESFQAALSQIGITANIPLLSIILPVGISFYTFQTMAYTIDVYQKKIKPTQNFIDFALFVSFFPQLVAGPIERAGHLLPQLANKRKMILANLKPGIALIFLGLFKKIVIANNLAPLADAVFNAPFNYSGLSTLIGIYAFTFQIYCDFSGYTDIARGSAKCLGVDLMQNFRQPYFATNPQDFWRRWHISLSTWLKDYLYIPLGGSKKGNTVRNLMITMLIGGLWHGAAMHFVFWGAYHGLLLSVYRKTQGFWQTLSAYFAKTPRLWKGICIFFMFHLTCLGWVLFRAQTLNEAYFIVTSLFNEHVLSAPQAKNLLLLLFLTIPLLGGHYLKEKHAGAVGAIIKERFMLKVNMICYLILMLIFWSAHQDIPFIYFQF